MTAVHGLAAAERADLADLLDTLGTEQWVAPSLCAGWRVRDVVAHLIGYDVLGWRGSAAVAARSWVAARSANDAVVAAWSGRPVSELVAAVRAHLRPRGLTTGFGGRIALTDCLIHHQDLRRPLGLPRTVPAARLAEALPFAMTAPPLGARQRIRGLRLVATDLDFRHGDGPEVTGPGEALLLAAAGRADALSELRGPGRALLERRTTGRA
ncbi:maleylpyruvate isomerase family mycothiol-dependent enzyme [Pseudonocardia spirodelae]|uniref:Maleylpyruvate isomerase family mycothiol-dependent enzyme n=1 Tax=Pseudonocardia spirodelae TaxID=3133431 RepID=A0ABU8T5S0_9PSEU